MMLRGLTSRLQERTAQLLIDALVSAPRSGRPQRILSALLRQGRDLLLRVGDPIVSYEVAGRRLALPLSHELPFVRKMHPAYASNAGRIAKAVVRKYPELRAVDIGANVGDTVAIWREQAAFPILCIEGAGNFFTLLAKNTVPLDDVTITKVFLASHTGTILASVALGHGTGRLEPSPDAPHEVETIRLSDLLDLHRAFKAPKLLKVDTDGMDAEILMAETELLARARPVVLFEYDPRLAKSIGSDARRIFPTLAQVGYRMALVYDNTGEYLVSASLADDQLLDDLHVFSRHGRYLDVCAFHEEDVDIFEVLREDELRMGREALMSTAPGG